jgi:hypothetical protein
MHPAGSKEKGRPYLVGAGHRRRAPHTARCSESSRRRHETRPRGRREREREVNGRKERKRREVVNTLDGPVIH